VFAATGTHPIITTSWSLQKGFRFSPFATADTVTQNKEEMLHHLLSSEKQTAQRFERL
jgi:hypothetical protein